MDLQQQQRRRRRRQQRRTLPPAMAAMSHMGHSSSEGGGEVLRWSSATPASTVNSTVELPSPPELVVTTTGYVPTAELPRAQVSAVTGVFSVLCTVQLAFPIMTERMSSGDRPSEVPVTRTSVPSTPELGSTVVTTGDELTVNESDDVAIPPFWVVNTSVNEPVEEKAVVVHLTSVFDCAVMVHGVLAMVTDTAGLSTTSPGLAPGSDEMSTPVPPSHVPEMTISSPPDIPPVSRDSAEMVGLGT